MPPPRIDLDEFAATPGRGAMPDRERRLWIAIRRGLILVVNAISEYVDLPPVETRER